MIGIHPNLSNEAYHAHDSVSRSKLMDFDVSPYNYWALHLNPERPSRKSTKALDIGQAYHDMILQPDLFEKEYAVEPKRVFLKYDGQEAYDAYKAKVLELQVSGKIIIKDQDADNLRGMEQVLFAHPEARELVVGAKYEQSHFWKDDETGLLLKCRPDILHTNMFVDFKTARDASPRGFQNAIAQYGYHIQAAIIQEGILKTEGRFIENFIFLCQEKVYPYPLGIYILGEETIEVGRSKYRILLKDLKHAIMSNEFPGFKPETINLPRWAL